MTGNNKSNWNSTMPGGSVEVMHREHLDSITSMDSTMYSRLTKRSKARRGCSRVRGIFADEHGSIYGWVWRQLFILVVALLIAGAGLIIYNLDSTKDVMIGDNYVYQWLLYVGFVFAAYLVGTWINRVVFFTLNVIMARCGQYAQLAMFYMASFDGIFAQIICIILGWTLYGPIFEIVIVVNRWLPRLWGCLLAASILNGIRILVQRWILSHVQQSTYEDKVNEILKRTHYLRLLTRPISKRDYAYRANDPEWATDNEMADTPESMLMESKAPLTSKLNYVQSNQLTLYAPNGTLLHLKRTRNVEQLALTTFARLLKIPQHIAKDGSRTARKAAEKLLEGKASAATTIGAADVEGSIGNESELFKSTESKDHKHTSIAVGPTIPEEAEETTYTAEFMGASKTDKPPSTKNELSNEPTSEEGVTPEAGVVTSESKSYLVNSDSTGDLSGLSSNLTTSSQDNEKRRTALMKRLKGLKGLFGNTISDLNTIKSGYGFSGTINGRRISHDPKINREIRGELKRGHIFLCCGEPTTSYAINFFDANGDGSILADEFVNEFVAVYQQHKSLRESQSSQQSVSKAIHYVAMGVYMMVLLIICLAVWNVALAEVFVPIGMIHL